MNDLKKFFESQSESGKDLFTNLVNDLRTSAPQAKVERLTAFLKQLKLEIDEINRRRASLGVMLENVERVRGDLDQALKKGPSLDLELFRAYLMGLELELRSEIEQLKPVNKLEKKFDVMRRIRLLQLRQGLADRLTVEVLGTKPLPPIVEEAVASAAAAPHVEEPDMMEKDDDGD